MAAGRRRTRTGIPLAVLMAVLAAIFSSRSGRSRATEPARAPAPSGATTSQPATNPSISIGQPAAGAPTANTRSPGFANRQRLVEHYEKHGAEFPGMSMDAYLAAAQALRDAPVGSSVLEARRTDGVITRFDRGNGAFLAANRDRTIRTYFKPNDGERYFRRQAARAGGGS